MKIRFKRFLTWLAIWRNLFKDIKNNQQGLAQVLLSYLDIFYCNLIHWPVQFHTQKTAFLLKSGSYFFLLCFLICSSSFST